MGTYSSATAKELQLSRLKLILEANGVKRLYIKNLSPNDNSKNQPYFGDGELSALNLFPTGEVTVEKSSSKKSGGAGKYRMKASMPFSWIGPDGRLYDAPNAKLIMYPQYAGGNGETRFSGFLQQSPVDMSEWMDPGKKGRAEGRVLVVGVTDSGRVIGYLAVPDSVIAKELGAQQNLPQKGVFFQLEMDDSTNEKSRLLTELSRIHQQHWITGKRLDAKHNVLSCNSSNCGGYTLEAELGITPNSYSAPDYLGWELKQFGVTNFNRIDSRPITLMTPEPTGGVYKEKGVDTFIRSFGYPDTKLRPDRLNFGGVHKFGTVHRKTRLSLKLESFDVGTGRITDPDGGLVLLTDHNEVAAKWHYSGLIEHWKRKHNQAAYIPSLNKKVSGTNLYYYSDRIRLGEGTNFLLFLRAVAAGKIYYDPGIKMENASTRKPQIKRRSQFRIKSGNLGSLYNNFNEVQT